MTSRDNAVSEARIYAIHYLDNGGESGKFSKRHKDLYSAILEEEKRRLMVAIRYKILENKAFRNKIYNKFKVSSKNLLKPEEIYSYLETLSNKQLLSILQARKKEK